MKERRAHSHDCPFQFHRPPWPVRLIPSPSAETRQNEMKIYFGFTVAGDRSSVEAARRIVRALEAQGHEVLTKHLIEDNAWDADRRISAREVYARDMKWLEESDCFMAEVSGSSFGLGFETGYVLGAT